VRRSASRKVSFGYRRWSPLQLAEYADMRDDGVRRKAHDGPSAWRRLIGVAVIVGLTPAALAAWSPFGHRLVARVAANHLTATARLNVSWLLDDTGLADVAAWADQQVDAVRQTGSWHYVNLPLEATAYERDRDCPRQAGVAAGSRADRWRDCVVDRIGYHAARLADPALDRADRAVALKFLVHLIGDLHQPFHALAVARGGNEIRIALRGSPDCAYPDGTPHPCNLHALWDTALVAHQRLDEAAYVARLESQIAARRWQDRPIGTAAEWALESHALARSALLPAGAAVEVSYLDAHVAIVDERLAMGGLRLASVLNDVLSRSPAR
jgi:hypothetical protein